MNVMTEIGLYRQLDEMMPWNDRFQVLEVIGITDEAPDVKTFTFRSDRPGSATSRASSSRSNCQLNQRLSCAPIRCHRAHRGRSPSP